MLFKPDMHHTCLCIMPWLCLCVYHVVCSFPVLLLLVSSSNVAFVRNRSTTSVFLLHGLVLLPYGISGNMTIPSKSLLSLLASCSLFFYAYAAIPTTCYIMTPILPCQASNPPSQQTVVWLCYRFCSAPLIALLVAVEVCSMLEHGYCWDITIYLI